MWKSIAMASFIGLGATLLVPTASYAATPAVTADTACNHTLEVVRVPAGATTTVNASRTRVVIGRGASVTVNGNSNCIVGATGLNLTVKGNNNFVSAGKSNVTIRGTGNFFDSNGGNVVDCGGSEAILRTTDVSTRCVVS